MFKYRVNDVVEIMHDTHGHKKGSKVTLLSDHREKKEPRLPWIGGELGYWVNKPSGSQECYKLYYRDFQSNLEKELEDLETIGYR